MDNFQRLKSVLKQTIYVNGSKVNGKKTISKEDNIFISKYLLKIDGKAKDLSDELAISAIGIEKVYPNQK